MKCLPFISAAFALLAAILWGWSATVNVPVLKSGYSTLVSVMPDGSEVPNEKPFYIALKKIAWLNAGAAICAFASAFTQAITLFPKT